MVRLARVEVFAEDEYAVVYVMNSAIRRCFLMGDDEFTSKNFDHRRISVENELQRLVAILGIDLICFAIMSSHFHLVIR